MERPVSEPRTARKLSRNVFDDDEYVRAFVMRKRMASTKIKNLLSVFEDVGSTGDYNESGSTVKKKERTPVDKQCLRKKVDAVNMIGASRPRCEHGSPLSSRTHLSNDEDDDKHDLDFDFDLINVVRRENSTTRDDEFFSRRRSRSVPNLAELGNTLPMKNLKGLFLRAQNKETKPPDNTRMQQETPRPDLYTVTVNSNDEVPKKPSFLKNLSKHQNGNTSPSESGQSNIRKMSQMYVGRQASVPANTKKLSPPNVKNLRGMFETGNFSTNETKGTSPKNSPVPNRQPTSFQKDTRSSGKDTHVPEVKPKPKIVLEPVYDDPTTVQKNGDSDATDNSYCVPSHPTAPYDSVPLSEMKTINTPGPYAVVNLDPASETASLTVSKRPRKLSQSRRKIYENIAANKNAGETNGSNTSGDSGYSPRDSKNSESADESKFSDSDIDDSPIGCDSDFSDDVDSLIGDDENTMPTNAQEENFDITTFTSDYQKVAYEVLTTEKKYIERLHLLDQVFRLRISQSFPSEVVHQVFSNISSIYNFHKDFLLPQLEERMKQWESKPRIGDIMKLLAPFLRMYSDYVGNFDNAMKQLQIWTSKSTKFAAMIQEIQADPMCHQLSLQHHMLEPVQRVPRYQLLLKDYLKKLPEDSEDKTDAEKALDLISAAAHHSNNFMKSMDKFQKLLKINQMLDGEDIIDPTREFLKEGKITKIAARSGDQQERYLFLFNDVLICAQNRKLIGGAASYKVKARLDIDGMKIFDGENSRYDHTFRLESKQKTLELQGYSDEEKEAWMRAIIGAIQEHLRRKETFKALSVDKDEPDSPLSTGPVDGEVPLGSRAPRWVRDDEATMCMRCASDFGITRRRHHCRACGVVVCSRCSNQQAELVYDGNKAGRVCRKCYVRLKGITEENDVTTEEKKLSLTEDDCLFGSIMFIQQKSTWTKLWAVITATDIHLLRAPKDVRPVVSIPLPFYEVADVEDGEALDRPFSFKLVEKSGKGLHYLSIESKELKKKWMLYLQEGVADDSGRASTL